LSRAGIVVVKSGHHARGRRWWWLIPIVPLAFTCIVTVAADQTSYDYQNEVKPARNLSLPHAIPPTERFHASGPLPLRSILDLKVAAARAGRRGLSANYLVLS
jgi:hypothetical protein